MTNTRAGADSIAGIILAGGRSRRMGREKALVPLAGATVIARVAARLRLQAMRLAVSANGDPARFGFLHAPVLADMAGAPGDEGPLAGILAGLQWARAEGFAQVAFVPSDAPFLPLRLISRLADGVDQDTISVAESPRGVEPLFSLWPTSTLAQVEQAFSQGERSPRRLIEKLPHRFVHFDADPAQPDPFLNLNTPDDVATAERWIKQLAEQTLSTDRVRLRRWRTEDREPFAMLNADARVMEFFRNPLTRAESDTMVDNIEKLFTEHGFGLWAIEVAGVAPFVGFAGFAVARFKAPFTPCVEIGWRLAREHWGRGYATEAARLALAHGFGPLGLHEIVSFTAAPNQRSRAVMERLGMRRDPAEDFDYPSFPEGHPLRRHVLYRLDAQAYFSAR